MDSKKFDDALLHLNYQDAKSWIKYDSRSSRLLNWCLAVMVAAVAIGGCNTAKLKSIEKHKRIGVVMYEKADAKLDSAITYFYNNQGSMNASSKQSALEDIAVLGSEEKELWNSPVYQEYRDASWKASSNGMYTLLAGFGVASVLFGAGRYYGNKKDQLFKK